MNEVYCIDLTTKKSFTLKFDNLVKQRRFLLKCKHSSKLFVTGYTYDGQAEYEYLEFGKWKEIIQNAKNY